MYFIVKLCAVGCILRMPRSPMDCVFVFSVQGEDSYLGMVLNTKETLPKFLENCMNKAC